MNPSPTIPQRSGIGIDPKRYLRAVRKSLWILVVSPFLAALTAGVVSAHLSPIYEAHVSLLVRPAQVLPVDTSGAALSADQISRTYAELMVQRPLLDRVARETAIESTGAQLARHVKIVPLPNTLILDVSVSDTSPQRASVIANTLTTDFIDEVRQMQQQQGTVTNRAEDNLVVVSPAVPPTSPTSPDLVLNVAVAAVAGLLVAGSAALVRDQLDQTIRGDDELMERTGLPPIAHVPFVVARESRLSELFVRNGTGIAAEAYRSLRTNLLFSAIDQDRKIVVVTSPGPGEGKSRTTSNLAVAFAQAGYRTLLIDADFRRPSLHRIVGQTRNIGMSNLIIQDLPEDQLISGTEGVPNLAFIAAGPTPPNPSELLGSGRMKSLLQYFRERYNYILIDTPPVNAVSDGLVLASVADVVVLVVESGRTTHSSLVHARDAIVRVGGHIAGVVINKVRGDDGTYASYRHYEYGPDERSSGQAAAGPAPSGTRTPSRHARP